MTTALRAGTHASPATPHGRQVRRQTIVRPLREELVSLIKPRTRGKQFVQYRTRLEQQNHAALHAHAAFIGEDPEYVLNELIDGVLAKDKDFVKWRAEHSESFAPRTIVARRPEPRNHVGSRPSAALNPSTTAQTETRMQERTVMLHSLLEARVLLAMVTAACVGTWGLYTHPVQPDNPFLALVQLERPFVLQVLSYGYDTLWFTTPFLAASVVTSLVAIVAYRRPQSTRGRAPHRRG